MVMYYLFLILPLKCIKHSQDIKYFCESCNEEICEECKKVDKEHETSQIEIQEIKDDAAEKLLLNQSLNSTFSLD